MTKSTIKQRHLEAIDEISDSYEETADKCEAITEEIAIEFATWICKSGYYNTVDEEWMWSSKNVKSTSEIWDQFKKESEL